MAPRFLATVATLAMLILSSLDPAYARVLTTWDWPKVTDEQGNKKDKTTIIYCLKNVASTAGLPPGEEWKKHLDAAAKIWNDAKTGWTFKPSNAGQQDEGQVSEDCQVVLMFRDHNVGGGAGVTDTECKDAIEIAAKNPPRLYICLDPTPVINDTKNGFTNWKRGEGFDPTLVLAHELGHTLRLDHYPPAQPDLSKVDWDDPEAVEQAQQEADEGKGDDLLDQINPGDTKRDLSEKDKQEARDAVDRSKTPLQKSSGKVGSAGGNMNLGYPVFDSENAYLAPHFELRIPKGALEEETRIDFYPLYYSTVPVRGNVPYDSCPINWGVEIRSEVSSLKRAATLTISYEEGHFLDSYYLDYRLSGGGEESLRAYELGRSERREGEWLPIESKVYVDKERNTATFEISDFSARYFGIAGSCRERAWTYPQSRGMLGAFRKARLSGLPETVSAGGLMCVCGSFPSPEHLQQLTLDGQALGPPVEGSGCGIGAYYRLPTELQPGPHEIGGALTTETLETEAVVVNASMDESKLWKGEGTRLHLSVTGSSKELCMKLLNPNPVAIRVEGGDDQRICIPPGEAATRKVRGLQRGDFDLRWELLSGACPCADLLPPISEVSS